MTLSTSELSNLAETAIAAATAAGQMIAQSRPRHVEHKAGTDSPAAQVVTEIDRRSEAIIVEHLFPTLDRFDLGLLTEERDDDGSRFTADSFWCVDPLDGTLPFVEGGTGYAVSIALVAHDGTPLVGVVYDPVDAVLLHAIRGAGAFRDRHPWKIVSRTHPGPQPNVLSVFADRSFLAADDHDEKLGALGEIAAEMGLDGLHVAAPRGAVMNACGVLANSPACYVKSPKPVGGGSLWDFAATACLFHEVGASATDLRGDALDLNRPDGTDMGHRGVLFASDADLARRLRTRM